MRTRVLSRVASGERSRKVLRGVILIAVATYLALRLSEVGWGRVWDALPTHPVFYALFLVVYLSLPIGEVLVYRYLWRPGVAPGVTVFLRKRVLNKDVLGYSGELYLFSWARRHLSRLPVELLTTIKDANVVSALASTVVAIVLILVFLVQGRLSVTEVLGRVDVTYAVVGGVAAVIVVLVIWRFRRYLVSLSLRQASTVFSLYASRLLLGQTAQIAMWAVAMPDISLNTWFTFAAASLIVSRIPFVPAQDLVFIGAGMELSSWMGVPQADIAGMLLSVSVLDRALNALLFGATWLARRKRDSATMAGAADPLGGHSVASRGSETEASDAITR